ncbi:family 78 glycoside hydrolase catalytic domain [Herbiconiux sp. 11R-BC]|uniref:alpha-L-rhamnosidase n=1 Tax=Herbiconiux sp. 11R-BC TaxID=3111637 RepID=UPI003C0EA343
MTQRPRVDRVRIGRDPLSAWSPDAAPALGWMTGGDVEDWRQESAELRLVSTDSGLERGVRLAGRASVDVAWPFPPLRPRERVELSVRVRGEDGSVSDWSDPQPVTAAFLAEGEWRASFLSAGAHTGPARFRARVAFERPVERATLYSTALGAITVDIDGTRVGDGVLAPGWTSYPFRLVHDTADVTALLSAEGAGPVSATIEIGLAGAWFTESYGFGEQHAPVYGTVPAAALQLVVEHDDGSVSTVTTGPGWECSVDGPITASGIYAGESHDARRAGGGSWAPARVVDGLVPEARTSPVVRRIETVPVREVITTPGGATVLDFGQNLVGRVRLVSRGEPGDTITLRHAEVLENGELGLRPLRRAAALDRYTHGGEGPELWEPEFTFHGFRYVQVDGAPGLDPLDYRAVVIHSELERTGRFSSSEPLLERLHENVVWSLRGNALALPTDCPQRDERLGWTGDVQVFAPSASFLYDCDAFLASWLRDLDLEQQANGGVVPVVVPWVLDWAVEPVAAWGDAATVVPTVLHERFGDRSLLERQFPSMTRWADHLLDRAGVPMLIEGGFQFGDWLDPAAPPDHPEQAATSADFVSGAYFIRSLDLVASAARTLGRSAEAVHYADAARSARRAFGERHVLADGRLSSDAPTAYALALAFELGPAEARSGLGDRLAELVAVAGHRIATGFVGTPIILDALTATGHLDTAVELLLQTECPSWLYPVTRGATSVWERWDSMLPDGSINPGEMTSFNHYALGAVVDWLHRCLAGLAPLEPGYAALRIAPRPTARLRRAAAELRTPYGTAVSGWERGPDGRTTVFCRVPMNTRAEVRLPDGRELAVGAGSHSWVIA